MTNRTVFISGALVNLVHLTEVDAAVTHHWFNDRTITRFLARGAWPMTQATSAAYYTEAVEKRDRIILGIWHKTDNILIGTTGLHAIDLINQTAEFGIVIGNSAYHSNGIGSEVLQALCDHAFGVLNLRNVTLRVLGNNPRAQQCYKKCGFIETGRLIEHIFKDGMWVDEITMRCIQPDYQLTETAQMTLRIRHIVKHAKS